MIGGLGGFVWKPDNWEGYWYIGGLGFAGSQTVSDDVKGMDLEADVSLFGGGVFVEYRHPFEHGIDLVFGAMAGAGGLTLRAKGDDLGAEDDSWSENTHFAMGCPYGGVGYKPLDWMRIEAMAGYMIFEPDLSGSSYEINGMEMTDGDLSGQAGYMFRVLFGYGPV